MADCSVVKTSWMDASCLLTSTGLATTVIPTARDAKRNDATRENNMVASKKLLSALEWLKGAAEACIDLKTMWNQV